MKNTIIVIFVISADAAGVAEKYKYAQADVPRAGIAAADAIVADGNSGVLIIDDVIAAADAIVAEIYLFTIVGAVIAAAAAIVADIRLSPQRAITAVIAAAPTIVADRYLYPQYRTPLAVIVEAAAGVADKYRYAQAEVPLAGISAADAIVADRNNGVLIMDDVIAAAPTIVLTVAGVTYAILRQRQFKCSGKNLDLLTYCYGG